MWERHEGTKIRDKKKNEVGNTNIIKTKRTVGGVELSDASGVTSVNQSKRRATMKYLLDVEKQ